MRDIAASRRLAEVSTSGSSRSFMTSSLARALAKRAGTRDLGHKDDGRRRKDPLLPPSGREGET